MKTILIIDDDNSFRELVRTVLEAHGFRVLSAANTNEGLGFLARHDLDAIVTDYDLPESNGLVFCRVVSRENARLKRRVPIWMMTGVLSLTEEEAREAGAEGIFRKPFRVEEMAKAIGQRLRGAATKTDVLPSDAATPKRA